MTTPAVRRLTHTFVPVVDQDEALTFYRDVLGLEVLNDVNFGDFRWLSLGLPEGGPEIVLETMEMGRGPEEADLRRQLAARGGFSTVIFGCDDADATFERIRSSGAEVLQEPIDQPYGVRDFAFRDPSGNHIRFSAAKAD